jgi:transposase
MVKPAPRSPTRPRRAAFWAPQPPMGEAFPQTCSVCDCCGKGLESVPE